MTIRLDIRIFLLCILAFCEAASATTYYVSPLGSNTSPYDTYAKAAHNIQDAVDQMVAGDTLRIGAGVYRPDTTILLRDSIAVIGAGRDSTTIIPDSLGFYRILELRLPEGKGMGLSLRGCTIRGYSGIEVGSPLQYGLTLQGNASGTANQIRDNAFIFLNAGVYLTTTHTEVFENGFDSCDTGISMDGDGPFDIHHNTFTDPRVFGGRGIDSPFALFGPTRIHHNIVSVRYTGIATSNFGDSIVIENNLLVNGKYIPLFTYCDCSGALIRNNTLIRVSPDPDNPIAWFSVAAGSLITVENNGFAGVDGYLAFTRTGQMKFGFNNMWGLTGWPENGQRLFIVDQGMNFDSSDGNLYSDPMFADDSLYRLQRGSPLIDAGNPAVLDPDGTRSDIGWLGGPGGSTYAYPELPPTTPDSVIGSGNGEFLLWWKGNSEADLAGYRVYRSSQSGFLPSGANLRSTLPPTDSTLLDALDGASLPLYYKVTAYDTTGLESGPSDEVDWSVTGIFDPEDPGELIPNTPAILRAYPNPFNAALTVEYFIPDVGDPAINPHLTVLNILGQHVRDLNVASGGRGTLMVTWDGKDSTGNDSPSGIYLLRLSYAGLDVVKRVALVR